MIAKIKRWIHNKLNLAIAKLFALSLIRWMQENREASMNDLNDWLEKNGWQCTAIAIDGSKFVYENHTGAQLDINMRVTDETG